MVGAYNYNTKWKLLVTRRASRWQALQRSFGASKRTARGRCWTARISCSSNNSSRRTGSVGLRSSRPPFPKYSPTKPVPHRASSDQSPQLRTARAIARREKAARLVTPRVGTLPPVSGCGPTGSCNSARTSSTSFGTSTHAGERSRASSWKPRASLSKCGEYSGGWRMGGSYISPTQGAYTSSATRNSATLANG